MGLRNEGRVARGALLYILITVSTPETQGENRKKMNFFFSRLMTAVLLNSIAMRPSQLEVTNNTLYILSGELLMDI